MPKPYPAHLQAEALDTELRPLREATAAGDPIDAAEAIARLQESLQLNDEYSQYINEELHRRLLDSRGLLQGLLFAKTPTFTLRTRVDSVEGRRIRGNLNVILASEETVGFACSAAGAQTADAREACATFRQSAEDLKVLHQVADRLAARGASSSFMGMMDGLEAAGGFLKGLARGVVQSAAVVGIGVAAAAILPEAVIVGAVAIGVGAALWSYDKTAQHIQDFATRVYETVLEGSAGARGELAGQLTTEVAGLVVGATATQSLRRALFPGVEHALTRAAVNLGARVAQSAGKISPARRAAIETLSETWPRQAAEIAAAAERYGIRTEAGLKAYGRVHEALKTLPEGVSVKRIREGTDLSKIRVIGRSMGSDEGKLAGVKGAACHIRKSCIDVERFTPDERPQARGRSRGIATKRASHGNSVIPEKQAMGPRKRGARIYDSGSGLSSGRD